MVTFLRDEDLVECLTDLRRRLPDEAEEFVQTWTKVGCNPNVVARLLHNCLAMYRVDPRVPVRKRCSVEAIQDLLGNSPFGLILQLDQDDGNYLTYRTEVAESDRREISDILLSGTSIIQTTSFLDLDQP